MYKLTSSEVANTTRILKAAGFSHAWRLELDDDSEVVFLVPADEVDGVDLTSVTREVMGQIAGRKIAVAGYVRPLPTSPLY